MSEVFAGVDVGGSGMRVHVASDSRRRSARDLGPLSASNGEMNIDSVVLRLDRLLDDLVATDVEIERIAIGLTGMPGLFTGQAALAAKISASRSVHSVTVASDALTSHLGALQGLPGTIVAAGTGVIALGTDFGKVWDQADGWGHLLGDTGGGAWVGARGLDLALRALDRRAGGSSALLELAVQQYGTAEDLVKTVYQSDSPAHEVARFAPLVAQAANAGDAKAEALWSCAGRSLAAAAIAASAMLDPIVSWGGRLFSAGDLLIQPFTDEVQRLRKGAEVIRPAGEAADGALLLATRSSPMHDSGRRFAGYFDFDLPLR